MENFARTRMNAGIERIVTTGTPVVTMRVGAEVLAQENVQKSGAECGYPSGGRFVILPSSRNNYWGTESCNHADAAGVEGSIAHCVWITPDKLDYLPKFRD